MSRWTRRIAGVTAVRPDMFEDFFRRYQEDRDNYIDIILVGDQVAARSITFVEIPG